MQTEKTRVAKTHLLLTYKLVSDFIINTPFQCLNFLKKSLSYIH